MCNYEEISQFLTRAQKQLLKVRRKTHVQPRFSSSSKCHYTVISDVDISSGSFVGLVRDIVTVFLRYNYKAVSAPQSVKST